MHITFWGIIILRKKETESAEIITEIENVYKKYVFCCKEDILTSFRSFTREYDPTFSRSGLSKGTNQTNKHTRFKEIRGWVCVNDNGNIKLHKHYYVCHKEDI